MAVEKYNNSYKEIINLILDCLDYNTENTFNTLIVKKLKELRNLYADEVIFETIKNEGWKIKNKIVNKESQKIMYFFAIIKNTIYFYNQKYNDKKTYNEKIKKQAENNFIEEDIFSTTSRKTTSNSSRDISFILEDFE